MVKKKGGRPSAVETSPYRKEIEEMLREGKSPDFIGTWLRSNGESISRSAIYRYKNEKFNIQAEAVKKYNDKKSRERLDDASDDVVDDIERIDESNNEIFKHLDYGEMSQRELIQLLNNNLDKKYKILGVIKDGTEVNIGVRTVFDNEAQKRILEEEGYDE